MKKASIGLIGLAVMWANLARNIANNWYKTLVYNRSENKTRDFLEEYWSENLDWSYDLKEFVTKLETPRKIIIMVKAWKPVDGLIDTLIPLLDKEDIIIDCGNSFYWDTNRRFSYLKEKWINFIWCWVSGGEEWALNWPSIMPGWDKESWLKIKNILEDISAEDFNWWKCVSYIWNAWSGHFVKMVHNGIEYAVMQMISEAYDSLRKIYKLNPKEIANIFKKYNEWKLNSYLFEITYKVLEKKDEFDDNEYLIDKILDKAGAKWTWKWTSIEWYERARSISTIWEATFARAISSQKELRTKLSNIYNIEQNNETLSLEEYVKSLENTLYVAMLFAYAQWYSLIAETSKVEKWDISLADLSRIWQWGCIIRAQILGFLNKAFTSNKDFEHLLELGEISDEINKSLLDYKKVIKINTDNNIAIPSLSSGLNYFYGMIQKDSSANLIQWLRDHFWAHTYERNDREWTFHSDWN